MKTTLRTLGIVKVLTDHPAETPTIEHISQYVTDLKSFISGALTEFNDSKYAQDILKASQSLKTTQISLQQRVYDLFGDSRIYGLIGWFLEQEGLEFTNEQSLKNRVRHEYEAARTLQFYEDKRLTPCYHNLVAQGNGRLLHMSDIVEALKGSGY